MSTKNSLPDASAAASVFDAIHDVLHRYRASIAQELRTDSRALTHMELRVLGFFAAQPGMTLSALVEHSGKDKAQLARLVRDLRDRKLLQAQSDKIDRRVTRLQLTEAGKLTHASAQAHQSAVETRAIAGLNAEECAQITHLMERIRHNLES